MRVPGEGWGRFGRAWFCGWRRSHSLACGWGRRARRHTDSRPRTRGLWKAWMGPWCPPPYGQPLSHPRPVEGVDGASCPPAGLRMVVVLVSREMGGRMRGDPGLLDAKAAGEERAVHRSQRRPARATGGGERGTAPGATVDKPLKTRACDGPCARVRKGPGIQRRVRRGRRGMRRRGRRGMRRRVRCGRGMAGSAGQRRVARVRAPGSGPVWVITVPSADHMPERPAAAV